MIGDGIATDLAAARAVGARCVLMLTGVTTAGRGRGTPRRRAADRGRRRRRRAAPRSSSALAALGRRQRSEPASSGIPRAQASNSARSGASVGLVGEGDVERAAVDRPQLGERQPDRLDRVERTPRTA